MDTIRSYPRTLRQAFPKDPDYAAAIEKPRPYFDKADQPVVFVCCLAVLVIAVLRLMEFA